MAAILKHAAAGQLQAVQKALDSNPATASATDARNQQTALHMAAQQGHGNIVKALLAHGASHDAADSQGSTPLHLAAEAGHAEVVALLVGRGMRLSVKARNQDDRTPLHLAALHGHTGAARELLSAGAQTQIKDKEGKTPIDLAPYHSAVRVALANGVLVSQSSLSTQLSGVPTSLGLRSQKSGTPSALLSQQSGTDFQSGLRSQASLSSPLKPQGSLSSPLRGQASVSDATKRPELFFPASSDASLPPSKIPSSKPTTDQDSLAGMQSAPHSAGDKAGDRQADTGRRLSSDSAAHHNRDDSRRRSSGASSGTVKPRPSRIASDKGLQAGTVAQKLEAQEARIREQDATTAALQTQLENVMSMLQQQNSAQSSTVQTEEFSTLQSRCEDQERQIALLEGRAKEMRAAWAQLSDRLHLVQQERSSTKSKTDTGEDAMSELSRRLQLLEDNVKLQPAASQQARDSSQSTASAELGDQQMTSLQAELHALQAASSKHQEALDALLSQATAAMPATSAPTAAVSEEDAETLRQLMAKFAEIDSSIAHVEARIDKQGAVLQRVAATDERASERASELQSREKRMMHMRDATVADESARCVTEERFAALECKLARLEPITTQTSLPDSAPAHHSADTASKGHAKHKYLAQPSPSSSEDGDDEYGPDVPLQISAGTKEKAGVATQLQADATLSGNAAETVIADAALPSTDISKTPAKQPKCCVIS